MTEMKMPDLTAENLSLLQTEVWPFLEDIALALEVKGSALNIVIESEVYGPVLAERLRRLGYERIESGFIRVGHPIIHNVTVEVRN